MGAGEVVRRFDEEQVWDVAAASGRAYVLTREALFVVDVRSGNIVGNVTPPSALIDVIAAGA